MRTITAIPNTSPDGTLHLPLLAEWRGGKVRVVAELTPLDEELAAKSSDPAPDWIRKARGSVRLAPDEWQESIIRTHHAQKNGAE